MRDLAKNGRYIYLCTLAIVVRILHRWYACSRGAHHHWTRVNHQPYRQWKSTPLPIIAETVQARRCGSAGCRRGSWTHYFRPVLGVETMPRECTASPVESTSSWNLPLIEPGTQISPGDLYTFMLVCCCPRARQEQKLTCHIGQKGMVL
jgi:hypothetical protein